MKYALLVCLTALVGAGAAPAWLDDAPPVQWNRAGAALPAAPRTNQTDLAPGGRCAAALRPPSAPEDRALVRRGWYLIGPYQRFGRMSFALATSSNDGMCRPDGFQGFVFVNGTFAGTVSPRLMDSRTDASLSALSVYLYNENSFSASFARYSDNDPLCCPHASTSISYRIEMKHGRPVLVATEIQTSASAR